MADDETFDVFLSHNSKDKPAVRQIAQALKSRGLRVWLDEWELIPGRRWIPELEKALETTKAAAVMVGESGFGRWEQPEYEGALSEFVNRGIPVIPVLLPGAPEKPKLSLFLTGFTWVDLRGGITEEGLGRLQWGITGQKQTPEAQAPAVRVQMSAENAPGLAQVRVDNYGSKAIFTATARVTGISEQVSNRKFLQTYGLRWRSNGKDELTVATGAAGSLVVASTGETILRSRTSSGRDLHELVLEGYVEGRPAKMDWFRWHDGDSSGAVTINLEVTISSSMGSDAITRSFVVTSKEWGGVQIEERPPAPQPSSPAGAQG